jgi:hypothetical protein
MEKELVLRKLNLRLAGEDDASGAFFESSFELGP